MTRKQFLKKVMPMAASLIILVTIAFSCSALTGSEKTPEITNANDNFVTIGDISLSNEEVYQTLINQFGAKELRQYIDFELLTKGEVNYVEAAKADTDFDVFEIIERAKYNGITYEQAQTVYTQEAIAEFEASFEDRLVYNGYKDMEDYKNDLFLEHARALFTKDELIRENELVMADLGQEYEANYYTELCAVVVTTSSLAEAEALLLEEGLEIGEDGKFLNSPTDEAVLQAYVNIYNKVYGNKEEITYSNGLVLECNTDELVYNFEDLQETSSDLAGFLFRVLDTNNTFDSNSLIEYKTYTEPVPINVGEGTNFYLAYKVFGENQNQFASFFTDLTPEEYIAMQSTLYSENESTDLFDELFDRVIETRSSQSSYITTELAELIEEQELTIYDKYLKANFEELFSVTVENDGSEDVVFSYLDVNNVLQEVTADDFFLYLNNHTAPVAINLLNAELALADEDLYNKVVTDELIATTQAQVTDYKNTFQGNGYAEYGFDVASVNWDEFIYAAFQYRSELELYNAILTSAVVEEYKINLFTSDEIQEIYYDLMADAYENSFELTVKHFLVYADNNEDTIPDLLNDINWTTEQQLLANELLDILRTELTALNASEEVTIEALQAIELEYTEASYITDELADDYSKWAKFKHAGLRLKVEDLETVSDGAMVEGFAVELKAMYDEMVDGSLFTLISDNNVETEFGYHLIYSDSYFEKGDAYPEDEKVFPSRIDIAAFNANEFDSISQETLLFIGQYYTPVTNEYLEDYELTLFDDARALAGTVSFNDQSVLDDYNAIVAVSRDSAAR